MTVRRFQFAFSPAYRLLGLPFGVLPRTTYAEVGDGELRVRFGPWSLRTPLDNVAGVEESGGYALHRTAGPAHLSLADKGVTFATNREHGVCLRFRDPVRALDPTGLLRHPGATMTVAEPEAFRAAVLGTH